MKKLMRGRRLLVAVLASATLAGCANMASHDALVSRMDAGARAGGPGAALKELEASATSDDQRAALLYNLERGALLRQANRYGDSTDAFLLADTKVKVWEEAAKTDPQKLMGYVGAALISERLKNYEGQDYEKVWLTTSLALNRVAVGNFEDARVDIKRTHEREAVIAEYRAKETSTAVEEAKSKGAEAKGIELNGYPVETLNDPEVLALRNGYQNALSHYLAGYLYEAMNEPGLAAPGYRQAIELRPGAPLLEEGLRGLDQRTGFTWKRRQKMTDVLFVIEAGNAPARKPRGFTLPIPVGASIRTVSISYPVIEPSNDALLSRLTAGGTDLNLERVVDVNVMARRALRDEMPGMIARGMSRALAKAVLQDQMQRQAGALGAILGAVASAATEQADDRMWRTLPGRVYIARGYLPPGTHRLSVDGRDLGADVTLDGQYAVVPLRITDSAILVGSVGSLGKLPEFAEPVLATTVPEALIKPVSTRKAVRVPAAPRKVIASSAPATPATAAAPAAVPASSK